MNTWEEDVVEKYFNTLNKESSQQVRIHSKKEPRIRTTGGGS